MGHRSSFRTEKKHPKKLSKSSKSIITFANGPYFVSKKLKKLYSAPKMNEVLNSFLFPVTYSVKSVKNHATFFKSGYFFG